MMVKQTRILFGTGEIYAFRVRCCKCANEVVMSLSDALAVPAACPLCEFSWHRANQRLAAVEVLSAMRRLLHEEDPPMTIRFEIDGEGKPS